MRIGEKVVIDGLAYRLEDVLSSGAGSYGQVWAATTVEGKEVALKFINTEIMAQADPSLRGHWRAHLEREIAFLAGMDAEQSQHIVALINHGQVDGQPVLVLERLAANLGQWLVQQRKENAPPPDLEQILDWARQILAGLDVIHHAGFVYRDLKFSNILVDAAGKRLKLADFGSLKRENGDSTRSFIGTPATMAPEQALPVRFSTHGGEYLVDYRADYYALGLLLFGLLTRQPTTAAQRGLGQLLAQHGQEGAAQAGKQLGGLNDDERDLLRQSIDFWTIPAAYSAGSATSLAQTIERMLARDPTERPQSSAEIRAVLDRFKPDFVPSMTLAPMVATAHLVADWDDVPPPPPRHRRAATQSQPAPRWGRIAAFVGAMSVAGALAWAVVLRPSDERLEISAAPVVDAVTNSASPASVEPPAASVVGAEHAAPAEAAVTEDSATPTTTAEAEPPAPPPVLHAEQAIEPAPVEELPPAPAPPPLKSIPQPKPKMAAPELKPAPKPVVAAPEPKPAPKPVVAAPEPKPAPKPVVAAPEPKPAPKPVVATPEPKPAPKPLVAKRQETPAAKPPAVAEEKLRSAPSIPQVVKAAPPRLEKPVLPQVAKPVPVQRPLVPVAKVEAPRPIAEKQPLPPIRLESRRAVATPPASTLPPIQMVSRTQPVTAPHGSQAPSNTPNSAALPVERPAAARKAPAKNPVQQFQDDAARTSVAVRRDVEALTNWLGNTGNTVGSEVQRGLRDADQAVTRWMTKSGTKVERRDRWSDR